MSVGLISAKHMRRLNDVVIPSAILSPGLCVTNYFFRSGLKVPATVLETALSSQAVSSTLSSLLHEGISSALSGYIKAKSLKKSSNTMKYFLVAALIATGTLTATLGTTQIASSAKFLWAFYSKSSLASNAVHLHALDQFAINASNITGCCSLFLSGVMNLTASIKQADVATRVFNQISGKKNK